MSWLHAVPVTVLQNRRMVEDYVSVYSTEEKKKVKDPIRNSKAELSSSENYLQPLARVSVGSRINEVIQGHWILWGD